MNIVQRLRRSALCIYIAVEKIVADDVAHIMRDAADEIERLQKLAFECAVEKNALKTEIEQIHMDAAGADL